LNKARQVIFGPIKRREIFGKNILTNFGRIDKLGAKGIKKIVMGRGLTLARETNFIRGLQGQ
jgi:hypothetical protein